MRVSSDYPGAKLHSLLVIEHFKATRCTNILCKDCHPVSVGLLNNTQTNTRVQGAHRLNDEKCSGLCQRPGDNQLQHTVLQPAPRSHGRRVAFHIYLTVKTHISLLATPSLVNAARNAVLQESSSRGKARGGRWCSGARRCESTFRLRHSSICR